MPARPWRLIACHAAGPILTRVLVRHESRHASSLEPEGLREAVGFMAGNGARSLDSSPRVLLVDAEPAACDSVARALPGFVIHSTGSARRALERLVTERFAAAIVDASLPDGDGRDLCAALRRRGLTLPILMLSGLGQEADVVRGLDAGADDYLVKPFRPGELAARMRTRLRQRDHGKDAELPVGGQLFRPGEQTLSQHGRSRPTRLTGTETALLRCLFHAHGRVVSRDELFHHVWRNAANPGSRTVGTHISRLRGKVDLDTARESLLQRDGDGYRLVPAGERPTESFTGAWRSVRWRAPLA